jgi:hypothetical protein
MKQVAWPLEDRVLVVVERLTFCNAAIGYTLEYNFLRFTQDVPRHY